MLFEKIKKSFSQFQTLASLRDEILEGLREILGMRLNSPWGLIVILYFEERVCFF